MYTLAALLMAATACTGGGGDGSGGSTQSLFDFQRVSTDSFAGQLGGAFGALDHGGDTWVAVGQTPGDDGQQSSAVWTSPDTRQWTRHGLEGSGRMQDVAVAPDGRVVALGRAGPLPTAEPAVYAGPAPDDLSPVESEVFGSDALIPFAVADAGDRFVTLGTAAAEGGGPAVGIAVSDQQATSWQRVAGAEETINQQSVRIVDLAVGPGGAIVIVGLANRDGTQVGLVWRAPGVGRMDQLQQVAQLAPGRPVDIRDVAAGPDGAFLAVGAVTGDNGRLTPRVFRSPDGSSWRVANPRLRIGDRHDSASGYGDVFRAVTGRPGGWLASIDYHSVELVLTSPDGQRWSEAPLPEAVPPQEVPPLGTLAATADSAVAGSVGSDRPTLLRVGDQARQITSDAFPPPSQPIAASGIVDVDDGGAVVTGAYRAPTPTLAEPADSGGVVWRLDGSLEPSEVDREPFDSGQLADLAATGPSAVIAGYEQFVERNYAEDTIEPLVWTPADGSWQRHKIPPVDSATRMEAVLPIGEGRLLTVGSAFRGGAQQPVGWVGSGPADSWQAFGLPTGEGSPVRIAFELCRAGEDRILAFGSPDGEDSSPTGIWTASSGDPASFQGLPVQAPLGELDPVVSDCTQRDGRTLVAGASGQPRSAALWETTDGTSFTPLEVAVPDRVAESRLTAVAQGPDGIVVAAGSATVRGATYPLLVYRLPRGSGTVVLDEGPFETPDASVYFNDVAIVGGEVVLVGGHRADAGMWVAPLPGTTG